VAVVLGDACDGNAEGDRQRDDRRRRRFDHALQDTAILGPWGSRRG
jgi:hypothetical protein